MGASKGAPMTRKSRPTKAAERLSKCQLGGDRTEDNSTTLRVQLLADKIGMSLARARLLAPIIWEANHGC